MKPFQTLQKFKRNAHETRFILRYFDYEIQVAHTFVRAGHCDSSSPSEEETSSNKSNINAIVVVVVKCFRWCVWQYQIKCDYLIVLTHAMLCHVPWHGREIQDKGPPHREQCANDTCAPVATQQNILFCVPHHRVAIVLPLSFIFHFVFIRLGSIETIGLDTSYCRQAKIRKPCVGH